ncbi:head GIN domain-containing protein [Salegentibacter chungangensis]|uniref:Head GIN domain-containing protein n=1 Tax=Salegentibacter chungangensis TaxID=1335724 RepID=A0ABW3NUH8_9FLAO
MKKTILILATVLLGISSANAQFFGNKRVNGNGEITTQNRNTSSYDEVSLQGSMDVELVAGTEGKLKVEAESNLQEYILTEVEAGVLKISVEKGVNLNPSRNNEIKIIVPFKDLEGVYLTGSGDIRTTDMIKASSFTMKVTGSGDMKIEVEANNLEGSVTGSGDILLRGKANDFTCNVNGSGDVKAYDLKAQNVVARISGSGDIQVYASKSLDARVAGSGDVTYRGNPEKENFKTAGSGSITSN